MEQGVPNAKFTVMNALDMEFEDNTFDLVCALDIIDATYIRDIEPGELIVIDDEGLHSFKPTPPVRKRLCIFEYIYFARPDSDVDGTNVYEARKAIGARTEGSALVLPTNDCFSRD